MVEGLSDPWVINAETSAIGSLRAGQLLSAASLAGEIWHEHNPGTSVLEPIVIAATWPV